MPESSEIRIMVDYLNIVLENQIITNLDCIGESKQTFELIKTNLPVMFESVKSKGKVIYFTFYNDFGKIYLIHTILSGKWQPYEDNYCKTFIELENYKKIWFRNTKKTQYFTSCLTDLYLNKILNTIGIDILSQEFNLEVFKTLIEKNKNKNITCFLTDQTILSGIGDRTKSEVLYYAKLSPLIKVFDISLLQITKLYEGIRLISRIEYNTIDIYNNEYPNIKIYKNPNSTKTKTQDGKITYWDPKIQK